MVQFAITNKIFYNIISFVDISTRTSSNDIFRFVSSLFIMMRIDVIRILSSIR